MYIQAFHIDTFGILQNISLENIPSSLAIFLGHNEAGKSTLLNFFRSTLLGYPQNKSGNHKNYGPVQGGTLIIEAEQKTVRLTRRQKGPPVLTDSNGNPIDIEQWDTLLKGISRDLYINVYGFSLSELQALESLDAKSVRNTLYSASFGTHITSPVEVLAKLESSMDELFKAGGKTKPLMTKLLHELDELSQKITVAEKEAALYDVHATSLKEKENTLLEYSHTESNLTRIHTITKKQYALWESWERWKYIQTYIKNLPQDLELLPYDALPRLEKLLSQKEQAAKLVASTTKNLDETLKKINDTTIHKYLLAKHDYLHSLTEQKTSYLSAITEIPILQKELQHIENTIHERCQFLGQNWTIDTIKQLDLSLSVKDQFEKLSEQLITSRTSKEQADKELDTLAASLRMFKKNPIGGNDSSINPAMPQCIPHEHTKETLRTLHKLLTSLSTNQVLAETKKEHYETYTSYLKSLQKHKLPFVISIALSIAGITVLIPQYFLGITQIHFSPTLIIPMSPWIGYILLLSGATGLLLKQRHKSHTLRETKDKAHTFLAEHKDLIAQCTSLQNAIQELCEKHNIKDISLDTIDQLEQELEDSNYKQQILMQFENAQEKSHIAQKYHAQTLVAWEHYLSTLHLDPKYSPSTARKALEYMENIIQLHEKYIQTKDRLTQKEQDRDRLYIPLQQIAQDIAVEPEHNNWLFFLDSLTKQASTIRQLDANQKNLETQLAQQKDILQEASQALMDLLTSVNVHDEKLFRQKAHYAAKKLELETEQRHLTTIFNQALSDVIISEESLNFQDFLNMFSKVTKEFLEQELSSLLPQLTDIKEKKQQLKEELLKLQIQIDTLSSSKELTQLRIAREAIIANMNTTAKKWSTFATAKDLLLKAKSRFEKERQPAVLRSASNIFSAITEGKWLGVTTSIGEDTLKKSLKIIPAYGEPVSPDILSRGTQEQLYLSLRLAHIQNHTEHGIPLPIIMDDILVNFDQKRTDQTIHAFTEIITPSQKEKKRHQILFFTCHPHIAYKLKNSVKDSVLYSIQDGTITLAQ